jgi:outer membrane protein assembly factor BamB
VGIRWRTRLGPVGGGGEDAEASAPVVTDGRAFVAVSDGLHALDVRRGSRDWRTGAVSPNAMSPTFSYDRETVPPVVGPDGTVFVGGTQALTALDPADGSVRWRYDDANAFGTPTATDGAVFVGSDAGVLALDAGDGSERWRADAPGEVTPNVLAVGDGAVVVATDGGTRALDRATGEQRWSASPRAEQYPVVRDGTVFVGTYEGLFAFELSDGKQRWRFERGSGRSMSSPVVTEDTIYVVERPGEGPDATFALDRTDGKPTPRWCSYVGEGAVTAAAGGQAFTLVPTGGSGPTPTPSLVAFTDRFGEALWGYHVRDRILPPAVVDGAVVVTERNGHVTAVGEVDA